MRVWVVTKEWGFANYWNLLGVFSSLEKAKTWVEGLGARQYDWTEVRNGEVWLYADYCVYRATVDGGLG